MAKAGIETATFPLLAECSLKISLIIDFILVKIAEIL